MIQGQGTWTHLRLPVHRALGLCPPWCSHLFSPLNLGPWRATQRTTKGPSGYVGGTQLSAG
jgi:hypothetical protein